MKRDFEALPKDDPLCQCRFTDMDGQKINVSADEGHPSWLWIFIEDNEGEEHHIRIDDFTAYALWRQLRNWTATR